MHYSGDHDHFIQIMRPYTLALMQYIYCIMAGSNSYEVGQVKILLGTVNAEVHLPECFYINFKPFI